MLKWWEGRWEGRGVVLVGEKSCEMCAAANGSGNHV